MTEIKLTKDSDALICVLYKEYLQKRRDGIPKGDAKWLGSAEYIHETVVPNWILEDVDETCFELSRADLLTCQSADDTIVMAVLNDNAIIYMENRFKDGFSEVLSYIEKIKSILLW